MKGEKINSRFIFLCMCFLVVRGVDLEEDLLDDCFRCCRRVFQGAQYFQRHCKKGCKGGIEMDWSFKGCQLDLTCEAGVRFIKSYGKDCRHTMFDDLVEPENKIELYEGYYEENATVFY
eukprot:snap_masked-scaffold_10-processed-gene-1.45-mRNA-1 protein AED:1.00 eAED:1.00 QI:0/-1/0/0/-1/1/1/0/118